MIREPTEGRQKGDGKYPTTNSFASEINIHFFNIKISRLLETQWTKK